MSEDELGDLLETYGLRTPDGELVQAFLRRRDEDTWDYLVADRSGLPLQVWGPATADMIESSPRAVVEEGHMLHVVLCTPPGVTPAGQMVVPADDNSSPIVRMRALVLPGGLVTELPDLEIKPAPPLGPDLARNLMHEAASRIDEHTYRASLTEAVRGDPVTVMLDWDSRPLRLWFDWPNDGGRRLCVIVGRDEGFVLMEIDLEHRLLPIGRPLDDDSDRQVDATSGEVSADREA
jgi:hypothetical protein